MGFVTRAVDVRLESFSVHLSSALNAREQLTKGLGGSRLRGSKRDLMAIELAGIAVRQRTIKSVGSAVHFVVSSVDVRADETPFATGHSARNAVDGQTQRQRTTSLRVSFCVADHAH